MALMALCVARGGAFQFAMDLEGMTRKPNELVNQYIYTYIYLYIDICNYYIACSLQPKKGKSNSDVESMISLLASLYSPIVNPAMVSTVRFYDRNELYGSQNVRNCRMPNCLG